jgi:hypothetical protein
VESDPIDRRTVGVTEICARSASLATHASCNDGVTASTGTSSVTSSCKRVPTGAHSLARTHSHARPHTQQRRVGFVLKTLYLLKTINSRTGGARFTSETRVLMSTHGAHGAGTPYSRGTAVDRRCVRVCAGGVHLLRLLEGVRRPGRGCRGPHRRAERRVRRGAR